MASNTSKKDGVNKNINTKLAKKLQNELADVKDYYVNPKRFSIELAKYYETDVMSDELVTMACNIAHRLGYRPNFINYPFKDDMIGDAVIKIMSALTHKKFNPSQAKGNPFSYFTTIAFNAFKNRIKKEKKAYEALRVYQEETYNKIMGEIMPHKVAPYKNNSDYYDYNN